MARKSLNPFKKVMKSTVIITVLMAFNFGLVFLTQVILAQRFGAQFSMDAFLAARAIPFLVTTVFLDSSRATFIPVFVEYRTKNDGIGAREVTIAFTNSTFIILLFVTLIGIITAPWLMSITVPGFIFETRQLSILLTRIIFPIVIFSGLADLLSSVYYALEHPLLPSIGPLLNSLVIIGSVFVLVPKLGIRGLAIGTLGGSIARFLLLVPGIVRKYGFSVRFCHPGVLRIRQLMMPVILGAVVGQTAHLVDKLVASFLSEGSITYLGYGDKLARIIVVLLRDGLSLAIFPHLSIYAAERNIEGLRKSVSLGIRIMMLAIVPVICGLAVLSTSLIQLVFERGAFTAKDTSATTLTLLCYSGVIFSWPLTAVATQAFWALKDTKVVMAVVIIGAITNMVLDLILVRYFTYAGIASACSIAAFLSLCMLLLLLSRRLGGIQGLKIIKSFAKIGVCALLMVLAMIVATSACSPIQTEKQIISLGIVSLIGVGVYMGNVIKLSIRLHFVAHM